MTDEKVYKMDQKKEQNRIYSAEYRRRKKDQKKMGKDADIFAITDEERERALNVAPDYILTASVELQEKYVNYMVAQERFDNCEDRNFVFVSKTGDTHTIDLANVNVKGMVLSRNGTEEQAKDAVEIRKELVYPIQMQLGIYKKIYYKAFGKEGGNNTLTPDVADKIIDLAGRMHNEKDIAKILEEEDRVLISNVAIRRFLIDNKAKIEENKTKFVLSSGTYRVATEAGRLEILNDLLTDLNLRYKDAQVKRNVSNILLYSREIRNVLEQARKEVKGEEVKLTVDGRIDITATIHGHENIGRTMRALPINAIVIGIVAAKSGLAPEVLIAQLASTYYKDFNGFNKNILGREQIMLPGDLIRNYDWNEIKERNKRFLNEMKPIEIQEATILEEEKGERIKLSLKEKIERLKQKK